MHTQTRTISGYRAELDRIHHDLSPLPDRLETTVSHWFDENDPGAAGRYADRLDQELQQLAAIAGRLRSLAE
jgi:hypothetical protein